MAQVSGKVAIVTGGASGIGEACAETLAREGAAVVVTDVDELLGQGVVQKISKAGGKVAWLKHDVRDEAGWPAVIAEAEKRFGRLDIMVSSGRLSQQNIPNPSFKKLWNLDEALSRVEGDYDLVIIDTAGRLAVDEKMMEEMRCLREHVPENIDFKIPAVGGAAA